MSRLCSSVWVPMTTSSTWASGTSTEPRLHGSVEQQPVLEREPAMVESGHARDSKEQVEPARVNEPVADSLEQRHSIGDGVAHDEHLRACVGGVHSLGDDFLRLVEMGPAVDRHPLDAPSRDDRDGYVAVTNQSWIRKLQRVGERCALVGVETVQRFPRHCAESSPTSGVQSHQR